MHYSEGDSIGSILGLVVQNHEAYREEYWAAEEQDRRFLLLVDAVAGSLFTASQDLLAKPLIFEGKPFDWEAVEQIASMGLFAPQIREKIEIEIAHELTGEMYEMAGRCFDLAKLVLHTRPNATVMRFLQRLARCYVAGFLPECVMLCRAVMENAVTEAFSRKSLPLPQDEDGRSTMRQKLDAAVKFKLLTTGRRKDAELVWTRGNKAVHHDPLATKDVYGTIEITFGILQELYGDRREK